MPGRCRERPGRRRGPGSPGIHPGDERQKTAETTADVEVEKQTKVIDKKTGEVISDKTESTPVTIQKEKEVETDVDVKVGETQSTLK